jgi:hypothetical protein
VEEMNMAKFPITKEAASKMPPKADKKAPAKAKK